GVVPVSRTLDHVGPLARSVADAYGLFRALVGDAAPRALAPARVAGLRVAVPRAFFFDILDSEVRQRFDEAIDRLRAAGARVSDTEIRHAGDIASIYLHIVLGDAAAYHAKTLEAVPERYTPSVRLRLEMGRHVMAEDYVRALKGREVLRRVVDAALADQDAVALPQLA